MVVIPAKNIVGSKKIGNGAFGDVLEAMYNGAKVAVKKSSTATMDKNAILKERKLFASIPHHPNVIHVLGVCEDTPDGQMWIVMEFAPLGSVQSYLKSLIESTGSIPQSLALEVIAQAGTGLSHLHASGIMHRDVRAVNYLVASEKPLRILITDFGLSHVMEAGSDTDFLTYGVKGPTGMREMFTVIQSQWDHYHLQCVFMHVDV